MNATLESAHHPSRRAEVWSRLTLAGTALLPTLLTPPAVAGGSSNVYAYDDGMSNNAYGGFDQDICALHMFVAVGGADTITSISAAFCVTGSPSSCLAEGTPITLVIWDDPNDDGNPLDAVLLVAANDVILNPGTDILNEYQMPPTVVTGTFFVGYYLSTQVGQHPCSLDGNPASNGRAWLSASYPPGSFDPYDLSMNDLPPTDVDELGAAPGVFLLRAVGQGNIVGHTYCYGDGSGSNCPCSNESGPGSQQGCANSSGNGGAAFALGSSSVSVDDLEISAQHLLPNQPALLFAGEQALNGGDGISFGDGLRCAGGNVVRLQIAVPDGAGVAAYGPGLQPTGGWMAGETRRLQVWYRDPTNSPCGNKFNLTNGIEVTFIL